MKKGKILGVIFLAVLLFSGCSKKEESTSSSPTSKSSSALSSSTSNSFNSSSIEQMQPLWNSGKMVDLRNYMKQFSTAMNQSYKEYLPGFNVDFYGLQIPDDLFESKKVPFAVGNSITTAAWSKDGRGDADYNIVACFSDADTAPYPKKHLYFFAFHKEQPIVLITMQNQGMADKALHFDETENQDLKTSFRKIALGEN